MKKFKIEDHILYEDDYYLVINKPPMLSTLADRQQTKNNLLVLANKYCEDIKICHRLDKQTSGVLVFAKGKDVQRSLSKQFARKEIHKEYHAVVGGQHDFKEKIVRGAIYINKNNQARIDTRKGKSAKTIMYTFKLYEGHTLLKLFPITGRTHQIRIHAASRNASLVGDMKYGGKDIFLSNLKRDYLVKQDLEELPIIKRVALHSFKIKFKDMDGGTKTIEAPYPKDFQILLKQLEKYSSID